MRKSTLILLLLLFSANSLAITPVLAAQQYEYASVGISPAYQELSSGDRTTLTVVGRSTLGGLVYVNIPPSLELAGDAKCTSGCRVPFVTDRGDGGTRIDFNIDDEMATMSFTVVVSPSTPVGTVLNVNAYLVGGPDAIEMSSAMIAVVEADPTPIPPQSQRPTNSELDGNRMVYLEVSPPNLRMSPGGKALFHVQPVRWGMWENQMPQIEVVITVPKGLTVSSRPSCGRGDTVPEDRPCHLSTPTESLEDTIWTTTPGYDASEGTANGVYMTIRADDSLEPATALAIKVSATVDDNSLAEQPPEVASRILIVEPASLHTVQSGSDTVGAVLELRQGFTTSGSTCSVGEWPSQVGLWEVGLATLFAATSPGPGILDVATDGSGSVVCLVSVVFNDVPARDLYVIAAYDGLDLPCRACVFGTITTTLGTEPVFAI